MAPFCIPKVVVSGLKERIESLLAQGSTSAALWDMFMSDYLENIEPMLCIHYLEYILVEKQDESTEFHDRLAELYLRQTLTAKKWGDKATQEEMYSKLLHFLDGDQFISLDRLYGLLSLNELYEARTILLGRSGRHDQALEAYVYRLHNYIKAEEYGFYFPSCIPADLLFQILNPQIDSVEILQLLPPLVTAQDVKEFLVDALRAPVFDARVISQVSKARNDHLARKLVGLQTRRVNAS
ncbi:hypothetical protein BKA70DRAFT_1223822 [Coprinopsis sp. MPI-PUGE-AT-0042]|nr:hypothetical protein BKA70DRAFT_1223822 [Coprinopsis sp. MPI-PUGE-AT-0042]